MPASTLPSSTWVSDGLHVRLQRDRLDRDPGVLEHLARHDTARHLRLAQRYLDRRVGQVLDRCHVSGLVGGTAISMVFFAKSCGLDASPAVTTVSMFAGAAEANTSAGAPLVIWVARPNSARN